MITEKHVITNSWDKNFSHQSRSGVKLSGYIVCVDIL